jgi:hypothetical protein
MLNSAPELGTDPGISLSRVKIRDDRKTQTREVQPNSNPNHLILWVQGSLKPKPKIRTPI